MNAKIITDKSISLDNGFQRGQWVKFLVLTPEGKWEKTKSRSTGECTWAGDESVRGMEVKLEGKGIVGGFYGVSAHTYQPYSKGFFGFTAEELAGPTPERGYTVEQHGAHAHDWKTVETLADYLLARFLNDSFTPWSSMKDGVHSMPYSWGDQAAESYALVIDHKLVDAVTGCGDRTPYLTASHEKCLADGKIHYSDSMTDAVIARGEAEDAFWETAERIGVADQYRATLNAEYSEDNNKISGAIVRRINEAMVREEANSRADADKFGILRRLLDRYRKGQNPLPTLRKEKGGVWMFHRQQPSGLPESAEIFCGDNWWVVWVR